jgi:hypothetical protein
MELRPSDSSVGDWRKDILACIVGRKWCGDLPRPHRELPVRGERTDQSQLSSSGVDKGGVLANLRGFNIRNRDGYKRHACAKRKYFDRSSYHFIASGETTTICGGSERLEQPDCDLVSVEGFNHQHRPLYRTLIRRHI